MPLTIEQTLTPSQAARDAAWPIWKWLFGNEADEANFKDGDSDDHHIVQAFAQIEQHGIVTGLRMAAEIARVKYDADTVAVPWCEAADEIAAAIEDKAKELEAK